MKQTPPTGGVAAYRAPVTMLVYLPQAPIRREVVLLKHESVYMPNSL